MTKRLIIALTLAVPMMALSVPAMAASRRPSLILIVFAGESGLGSLELQLSLVSRLRRLLT